MPHTHVQLGVKQSVLFVCLLYIMFFADDLVQTTFQKVKRVLMDKLKDYWRLVKDPCTLTYIPSAVSHYLWVLLNYAHTFHSDHKAVFCVNSLRMLITKVIAWREGEDW